MGNMSKAMNTTLDQNQKSLSSKVEDMTSEITNMSEAVNTKLDENQKLLSSKVEMVRRNITSKIEDAWATLYQAITKIGSNNNSTEENEGNHTSHPHQQSL